MIKLNLIVFGIFCILLSAVFSVPSSQYLPQATGQCPAFNPSNLNSGNVVTFRPVGLPSRQAHIIMSSAARTLHGPVIIIWHGSTRSQAERANAEQTAAVSQLGPQVIQDILSQGGIIAIVHQDTRLPPNTPWYLDPRVGSSRTDDLVVADEIVGCAIQQVGIDISRIYVTGFSAGGIQAARMAFLRSGYVAAVVTYSGGIFTSDRNQDPNNLPSALIYRGDVSAGETPSLISGSQTFHNQIVEQGHYALICNHHLSHGIAPSTQNPGHPLVPLNQDPQQVRNQGAVPWQFLLAHPFGTTVSPWRSQLPSGVPGVPLAYNGQNNPPRVLTAITCQQ